MNSLHLWPLNFQPPENDWSMQTSSQLSSLKKVPHSPSCFHPYLLIPKNRQTGCHWCLLFRFHLLQQRFFSFVGAKLMGFWVEFLDKTCKSDCQPKLPINNYSELLCALQTHPEKIFGLFCLFVRCVCFCCKIFPSSRSFIEQSRLAKSPASLWSLNGRGEMNRTLRLIAKIHGKNRHLMHGW